MTSTANSSDTIYYDLTLQNDVLEYSNIYNFHSYEGNETKAAYARKSVLAYSPKDSVRPSFMTENGRKVWAGDDGVVYSDQMYNQCCYAIKACAKLLAEGTDKWFWFISRAFLEQGGGFGNAHAWTQQPYPIAAVTANLTYQLGKGNYKGRFANMPKKAFGYLFDRGDCDVAILFATESKTVSVKANRLIVSDMLGVENEMIGENGIVELALSNEPVFVRFDGRADEKEYFKTSYETLECKKIILPEEKRIVLNPIWENQDLTKSIVMQKGYLIEENDKQKITVRIYNFNEKAMQGSLHVVPEYEEHFVIDVKDPEFCVEPFGRADIEVVIKTTGNAIMNSSGDILFGATLSDGREVTSAVCRYWFKLYDLQIPKEDIKVFEGFDAGNQKVFISLFGTFYFFQYGRISDDKKSATFGNVAEYEGVLHSMKVTITSEGDAIAEATQIKTGGSETPSDMNSDFSNDF
jgi:hypothetical protein